MLLKILSVDSLVTNTTTIKQILLEMKCEARQEQNYLIFI